MADHGIEGYRLSPQQRRTWLAGADDPALTAQCVVALEGATDPERLHRAVRRVAERHDILRTRFRLPPGRKFPLQVVGDEVSVCWTGLELDSSSGADGEPLGTLADEEVRRAVENAEGPALRAAFADGSSERGWLILSLPARCADGVSLATLVREIAAFYAQGSEGPEGEEPFQYPRFAQWQNQLLEDEDEEAEEGRSFWQREVSGIAPPGLPLRGPAGGAGGGGRPAGVVPVEVEPAARKRWRELAESEDVTAEAIGLAAWIALVHRWSGRERLTLGVLARGREFDLLEGAVGLFARRLPLTVEVEPDTPFLTLARRVAKGLEQIRERQDRLGPQDLPVSTGYAPLPVGFALEDRALPTVAGDVRWSVERQRVQIDHAALDLVLFPDGWTLGSELRFDRERIDRIDVRELAGTAAALIEDAVLRRDSPVGDLRTVGAAEERSGERFPEEIGPPVHLRFAEQAERDPGAPAVRMDGVELGFGELRDRARELAHRLHATGVGPDSRVGLLFERSVEMLVGLLGVLEAGAAYVPLDPVLPSRRLQNMIADVSTSALVTSGEMLERTSDLAGDSIEVFTVEQVGDGAEPGRGRPAPEVGRPLPKADPSNLAYVLFTSGSTGRPKAVGVGHRQLAAYVDGIAERLEPSPGEEYALVSTFGADLGNTTLYLALTTGGCLNLVPQDQATDARALAEIFTRREIDYLKIVPSHFEALLSGVDDASILPRRALVLGGEVLGPGLVERIAARSAPCRVINHYGPTETTVGVTARTVRAGEVLVEGSVPVGCRLRGARPRVVDRRLRTAGPWVLGELVVAGAQVSRGYVSDPRSTARTFLPDPEAAEPGGRIYRTGDRMRRLPDGDLQFVGRMDDQIKLRGFRVEPGEVTAVLEEHPAVRRAVVTVDVEDDRKRLVAFAAADSDAAERLRNEWLAHLEEVLPAHMVPSVLVILDELPLTATGKVDRQALPEPEEASVSESYVAPRTPVEEVLAGIWAEVLGRERVGVGDDFFGLGGHSLLATQMISRTSRAFDLDLSIRMLFEAPTVAEMASRVERGRGGLEKLDRPPLEPRGTGVKPAVSFSQERLWFQERLAPGAGLYNSPSALRFEGRLDLRALRATLDELVRRHEILRSRFPEADGRPRVEIAPPGPVEIPVIDLRDLEPADGERFLNRVVQREARRPFDLARGPVLRILLLRHAEEEHSVLMTLHHIVSDAWSMDVMVQEVSEMYRAFVAGQEPSLPELPIQYADYALWHRRWLSGEVLERHVDFWRRRLADAPALTPLPTDRARPDPRSPAGARRWFPLPLELADRLKGLSRAEGVTLYMTLLAGFLTLLHRQSGETDLVVGTAIANRNHPETEVLIGPFINMLVLRADLDGDPPFRSLLARVRDVSLEAYGVRGLPFEKLVDELRPERKTGVSPFFQAAFGLQNAPWTSLELPDLTVQPLDVEDEVVRYDLTVWVQENEERFGARWSYATDLFGHRMVERLHERYERLLESAVREPGLRLDELELLGAEERERQAEQRRERDRETVAELANIRRRREQETTT